MIVMTHSGIVEHTALTFSLSLLSSFFGLLYHENTFPSRQWSYLMAEIGNCIGTRVKPPPLRWELGGTQSIMINISRFPRIPWQQPSYNSIAIDLLAIDEERRK